MENTPNIQSRVITEIPIQKQYLILSKTPECSYCGQELNPVKVILNSEFIAGYGPCDCDKNQAVSKMMNEGSKVVSSYSTACIPAKYQNAEGGEDYAKQIIKGRSLYIHGNVGVGKTYLACAILKHLARHGRVEFVSAVEATGFNKEDLRRVNYLVVDDIGKETSSEWSVSQIWDIINSRYSNNKPTIFTSQFNLEQIPERIERNGDYATAISTASRLYEMCDTVHLKGKDRRL